MQLIVDLQEPFNYSFTLLIILIIITILTILVYIYKDKIEALIRKNTLSFIKKRYLQKLDELEKKVNNNEIELRNSYQELSNIGRGFIKSATNIDVLTISLKEAKKLGIAHLTELMEECYPPEFEKISKGNVILSIDNARRIVQEWN